MLGPLRVIVDGGAVHLGGPRPRALFSILLVAAGKTMTPDYLVDQLWGELPPSSATKALHVHLSTLRDALGPDRVLTTEAGHALRVEPGEVDAERFQADPHNNLALWRGEPFCGVPSVPDVDAARLRLTELWQTAVRSRSGYGAAPTVGQAELRLS